MKKDLTKMRVTAYRDSVLIQVDTVKIFLSPKLTKELHRQLGQAISFIEFSALGLIPPTN